MKISEPSNDDENATGRGGNHSISHLCRAKHLLHPHHHQLIAMRILYFGKFSGTSVQRAAALRRLGHLVDHIDPRILLPQGRWIDQWVWHAGALGLDHYLAKCINRDCGVGYDVAWVNQGEFLGRSCLETIRSKAVRVVNYCNDDPFSKRDGLRFRLYRQAIDLYDHVFVARECNVDEAHVAGARAVTRFTFTADEVAHRGLPHDDIRLAAWHGQVVFVGTWFPERGPFLADLLQTGIKLQIRGPHWDKAPEWPHLRRCTDPRPLSGSDYIACLQGADAALCLLSRGNRDQQTTRSAEIPAIGGVLLAERTAEHDRLFTNGVDALLFENVATCAALARQAQSQPPWRDRIAIAGHQRVCIDGRFNEAELTRLLNLSGCVTGSTYG